MISKPRIVSFVEDCPGDNTPGQISTFSIDLKSSSPIIHLETIQFRNGEDASAPNFGLFVAHENGQVTCYGPKLQREEWSEHTGQTSSSSQAEPGSTHIHYSACLSIAEARKGVLKRRDDILAKFSEARDEATSSLLLLLRSTSSPRDLVHTPFQLKLYSIRVNDSLPNSRSRLQELLSHDITPSELLRGKLSKFSCHVASGTMYQQTAKGVAVYDLCESIPRLTHLIQTDQGDVDSCVRISSTLLATSTAHSINILGLPYCSLQGSKDLIRGSSINHRSRNSKKHKTISAGARPQLFSFSSQHKVLIAIDGSQLIATPILMSESENISKKRNRDGLLISSLGRGSSTTHVAQLNRTAKCGLKVLGQSSSPPDHDPAWKRLRNTLGKSLERGDRKTFDDAMALELGIDSPTQSPISQQKISYILSSMFQTKGTHEERDDGETLPEKLVVSLWPEKISQWLLDNGLLTDRRLESSLKHHEILPITSKLASGALIDALAEHNPSLTSLSAALASPLPLSPLDLAHTLVIVTRCIVEEESSESMKRLTSGENHSNHDEGNRMQIVEKYSTPTSARDFGDAKSPNLEISRALLRMTLERLHGFPSDSVTSALRDTFTKPELRSLVDILRLEIACNGWLNLYEDDISQTKPDSLADDHIDLISHALNSILDALGPAGWMLGSSAVDDLMNSADLLSYMKAEISAALEGVEEITYLKGMLGEILLCGKESLVGPSKKAMMYAKSQNTKAQQVRSMTVAMTDEESGILPLGLKLKPRVDKTKVGAGGELIPRSQRDIGRMKSRMVGKYSFERIVV